MHVNVIQASDACAFDYVLYPEQHQSTLDYLKDQAVGISDTLTNIGRKFILGTQSVYSGMLNSDAMRSARAALRSAKGIFSADKIVPLESYEEIMAAQITMQRYVMAEPTIRKIYHSQLCDGYSDTYVDVEPGCVGENQLDYRRVMSGIIEVDEDGWKATTYSDSEDDERELLFDEKTDILSTWELVRAAILEGLDVTRKYSEKLGT